VIWVSWFLIAEDEEKAVRELTGISPDLIQAEYELTQEEED
jgi:hypothetical protein